MSHISLTPAELAAHLPSAEHYRQAKSRMDALHADADADPHQIIEAEQQAIYARLELDAETPWADVPEADGPDDVITRTIPLDGGTAIVEHVEDRVEVTIRLGGRSVLGIALSHMEAANLGRAIASPGGATTGDLFHVADTLGVNAGDIMRLRDRAVTA